MNLILAIALGCAALALFGYLANLLWQAAVDPLAGYFERGRLAKCEEQAAHGDAALRDGRLGDALDHFTRAVYAGPVKSASMASAIERHHTGLLNRFLVASDELDGAKIGLLPLAAADRALRKRRDLQSSYVAALQTGNRRRRREMESALRANTKDFRKALQDLSKEIRERRTHSSVH